MFQISFFARKYFRCILFYVSVNIIFVVQITIYKNIAIIAIFSFFKENVKAYSFVHICASKTKSQGRSDARVLFNMFSGSDTMIHVRLILIDDPIPSYFPCGSIRPTVHPLPYRGRVYPVEPGVFGQADQLLISHVHPSLSNLQASLRS